MLSLIFFCIISKSLGVLFRPIQTASPSFTLGISDFRPEGLTYDVNRDRVIIASLSTGVIRAFPNTDSLDTINEGSSTQLYEGSIDGTKTPIVGIKVFGDVLYGAVGQLPPLTSPFYGGLLILDLANPSNVELVDFSSLYDGTSMLPNDVVYSSYANAVFVTDWIGYRIFKYDLSTKVSHFKLSSMLTLMQYY